MACDKIKTVLMGAGGVGKSALTLQMIQSRFIEGHDPTIEDSYQKYINVDALPCRLDVLDTAGQDDFKSMRSTYMRQGQGYILVYSVTDRASFTKTEDFWNDVIRAKGGPDDVVLVLVGNKCDLTADRVVTTEEGQARAQLWNIPPELFFEASAKLRLNVEEIFYALIRRVRTHGVLPCECKDTCRCRDRCTECTRTRNKHRGDHEFKERKRGLCTLL
jgi:small GTP-binding protein